MRRTTARWLVIGLLLLLTPGCATPPLATPPKRNTTRANPQLVEAALKGNAYLSDEEGHYALCMRAADLLHNERYEQLEQMAQEFRTNRAAFATPEYVTPSFSDLFQSVAASDPYTRDVRIIFEKFAEWWRRLPSSLQDLCEGQAFVGFAEDHAAMDDALEAKKYLLASQDGTAPEFAESCSAMAQLAASLKQDKRVAEQFVFKALQKNPDSLAPYVGMARYYRPALKQGTPEELEVFAANAATSTSTRLGEGMYAVIWWQAFAFQAEQAATAHVNWPRMKQGFIDLEKKYGPSTTLLNNFCHFACACGDVEAARTLFLRLDNEYQPYAWKDRDEFDKWQNWAFDPKTRQQGGRSWRLQIPTARAPLTIPVGRESAFELSAVGASLEFERAVSYLTRQEKFSELEEIARALRQKDATKLWPKGRSLDLFYTAVAGGFSTSADWEAHIALLERWLKAIPDSVTARIALAKTWTGYAWNARGSGYADKVSSEGWKLFNERLGKANALLDEAERQPPARDVVLYATWMTVARGQGWSRDKFDKLFEKATAIDPTDENIYGRNVDYLLPRWYGQPGEAERFAAAAVKRTHSRMGSAAYAMVAEEIYNYEGQDVFHHSSLSWPDVVEGFRDLGRLRPSANSWNLLARLACIRSDRRVAQEAFRHIGLQWSPFYWESFRRFRTMKRWANGPSGVETPPPSAEIVSYGRYRSRTTSGQQHLETTSGITSQPGTMWGLEVECQDFPPSSYITSEIIHPPFHLPDGSTETVWNSEWYVNPHDPYYILGWEFSEKAPWQMVEGPWNLKISYQGRVLASKVFTVRKAAQK